MRGCHRPANPPEQGHLTGEKPEITVGGRKHGQAGIAVDRHGDQYPACISITVCVTAPPSKIQEAPCEYSLTFVRMWAEAVLREVGRVREIRKKEARDGRNFERMEDRSPTQEDLQRNFRSVWAEEHTFVNLHPMALRWKVGGL